jgi:hypothetical protein
MDYEVELSTVEAALSISTSSVSTFQPQHHHGPIQQPLAPEVSAQPSYSSDVIMSDDGQIMEQDNDLEKSPSIVDGDEGEADDEEEDYPEHRVPSAVDTNNRGPPVSHLSRTPAHDNKAHLVVDTSVVTIHPSTPDLSASSMTATTPIATPFTPDSGSTPNTAMGTTAPSSRRSSIRTATATLPRSALQEETIALFKQFRNLIPCAKCFCRNTIQRDGMSGTFPRLQMR